jgi:hypothetical protein
MEYNISEKNTISIEAAIEHKLIIGVVDKEEKRTCIIKTTNGRDVDDLFVILPFAKSEMLSVKMPSNIDIIKLVEVNNFAIEKAFESWREAYDWMLGE